MPPLSPPKTPWHSLPKDTNSHNRVIKFTNARVFLKGKFRREDLWVRDGRVIDPASRFWEAATFSEYACDLIVDCEGHILCPGFIDLQCNGEFGDLISSSPSGLDLSLSFSLFPFAAYIFLRFLECLKPPVFLL